MILGETGTGKELVARALHDRSPRAPALRRGQLRGHPRDAARERALRAREGGLHRRRRERARGAFEQARRRHALPRRGRRAAARPAGEAPARARETRGAACRRVGGIQLRWTSASLRPPTATSDGRSARQVPRGPVLPALGDPARGPPAPGPARRRPGARPALPRRQRAPRSTAALERGGALGVSRPTSGPGNVRQLKNVVQRALLFRGEGTVSLRPRWSPSRTCARRPARAATTPRSTCPASRSRTSSGRPSASPSGATAASAPRS